MTSPRQHPVIDLVRQRIASGSQPGARADPFKLGLAIEGGGMRGVIACGMAAEIAARGGYDAFDAVYGTSAGAFAGAFFVARQMEQGPPMYFDDLANRHFISWHRLLLRKPVLNLHFLVQHGLGRLRPLDWQHIAQARVPLHVVVSSLRYGRSRVLTNFTDEADLLDALRASATLPYLAGPPVAHRADLLFDGGLFEPIPLPTALADGCTHVLVLRSRPTGRYCIPPAPFARRIVERRLRAISPVTADAFVNNPRIYKEVALDIEARTAHPTSAPYVFGVVPAAGAEIGRLERRRGRLQAGARAGAQAVHALLDPLALPAAA